jgi:3-methyladenine DNA glycosylase AlkD
MNITAKDAQQALRKVARPERVASTEQFFKAYPGGYSEGDKFLCCSVPATRLVAKDFYGMPLSELSKLISSEWHDDRLLALIILVHQYRKGSEAERQAIYDFCIKHMAHVNNWDLVDTSAGDIVGGYLLDRPRDVLEKLARSDNLWVRRVSMISTFQFLKNGDPTTTIVIAEILLHDKHDLIQKAVGWMLREMGKRVDRAILLEFLDQHAHEMPRTMLSYSVEHLPPGQRAHYRSLGG